MFVEYLLERIATEYGRYYVVEHSSHQQHCREDALVWVE